jgi:cytoskeletal protein CcmA (bactofilin family)
MTNRAWQFFSVAGPALIIAVVGTSRADVDESVRAPEIAHAVMIDEDYFSAGGSAELDKRVEGDAFLAGGRVAVRGPVKGDAVLAGGDINLSDTVGQNLYAAGASIVISSQVAGSARIAGGQVTLSQRGGIVGKATVGAASFRLSGRVGRYLVVYAESVRIDGEVGGDLRIAARTVELGPDAKIYGKLIYRSPHAAKIDPAAVIAGGVTHVELAWPREEVDSLARIATWVSVILLMLSLLVVGAIMILAFPDFSASAALTVRSDPWRSLALGFALLLCIPVGAILFMVTIVGIPLGMLLLFFYPVMLLLGYLTGALFLADRVAGWLATRRGVIVKPAWRYVALAVALLVLLLACKIPYAGGVIAFLVLLLGLGAFWLRAFRGYARESAPGESPRVGLDLV